MSVIKLDRAKRRGRHVDVLDSIANFSRVKRLGIVDCLGGDAQCSISLDGMVSRVAIEALEIFSVKFFRTGPLRCGQPLRSGEGVLGVLACAFGGGEFSSGESGSGRRVVPGIEIYFLRLTHQGARIQQVRAEVNHVRICLLHAL